MSKKVIGILAMAYGTPSSVEEILPYYTHIRRGRPPEPQQLQELTERYEAIGGLSPLNEITAAQAQGLERTLHELNPAADYRVYTGMKHAHPFIEETVQQMVADGIEEAIGVVWAPHYSTMSIGTYIKSAEEAREKWGGPQAISYVESWHVQPLFIDSTAKRVAAALAQFPAEERASVPVVFTAHSLPERILQLGDPYPRQIEETGAAVTAQIGHNNWFTGWQSAGRTPEPWLGPDILDVIREQHAQGVTSIVICPVGFVSDHLEVQYDIDIEAKQLADELGMKLVRVASPNDEPLFLQAVATAVLEQAKKG
ncbi:ferrochelatase [Tumebacillus algifaecis]|uniref:Coproporphyrin III ferrochelatase n=1 Tax=Tumebacillus algifaecis TaxID=1214604 RepID=A0A223CZK8_9BACL|nr:ferrochelatase [Tumebacillus algifaecis]ASS74788.1 ferrochelatase [Tumebacillus algifaecis]